MPSRWTLYAHPDAMRSLYTIPRGVVASINDAIRQLEHNPTPPASEQVDESLYRLPVGSYTAVGHR